MRTVAAVAAAVLLALAASASTTQVQKEPAMPLLRDAMYSWWVHPLAVADGDMLWVGSVDRRGGNAVHRVNQATGQVDVVQLAGPTQRDEHNGVALAVNPAQPNLIAFYARHDVDDHVRYQTVNRTTLAVGAQQQLPFGGEVTYAQVLQSGDTIHLLCRVDNTQWKYRTSTDWGLTWGPAKTLIDGSSVGQNYLQARAWVSDPNIVHLAHYAHPSISSYRDVGFAQLNLTTGEVRRPDGTLLGDLDESGGPEITPQQLDPAIEPSSGFRVRLLDVGMVQGTPALAYAVWPTAGAQTATYKVKRLVSGAWSSETWELPAGEAMGYTLGAHYHGGMAFGESGKLWTSRKDGGQWVIEQWLRVGPTFELVAELARGGTWLLRPYPVRNPGAVDVIWQDAIWDHFIRYYGDLVIPD